MANNNNPFAVGGAKTPNMGVGTGNFPKQNAGGQGPRQPRHQRQQLQKPVFGGPALPPSGTRPPPNLGTLPGMERPIFGGQTPPPNLGTPPGMGVGRGNFPQPGYDPATFHTQLVNNPIYLEGQALEKEIQAGGGTVTQEHLAKMRDITSRLEADPALSKATEEYNAYMRTQGSGIAQLGQNKANPNAAMQAVAAQTAASAAAQQDRQAIQLNAANATAQMPEASAEMQTRARLQAAQPNTGAGPGNPTSASNNQPGQMAGLISGQMQNRPTI